jgi:hypothetical protein
MPGGARWLPGACDWTATQPSKNIGEKTILSRRILFGESTLPQPQAPDKLGQVAWPESSVHATDTHFPQTAMCRGVSPRLLNWFTSAPARRSTRMTSMAPADQSAWRRHNSNTALVVLHRLFPTWATRAVLLVVLMVGTGACY